MKDYCNDGSYVFVLQNQFTAFVQVAVRRTRNRYLRSLFRIQNTEITSTFEKGAISEDDGDSAFFYAASNNDDFWDISDISLSLVKLLQHLSAQEQLVLKLHVFKDLPFRLIAVTLNKNESTVKATYYAALDKLTKLLGDEDGWDF